MRIIEPGRVKFPEEIKFECDNCGCVFACERNETRMTLEGDNYSRVYIFSSKCPCCEIKVFEPFFIGEKLHDNN